MRTEEELRRKLADLQEKRRLNLPKDMDILICAMVLSLKWVLREQEDLT